MLVSSSPDRLGSRSSYLIWSLIFCGGTIGSRIGAEVEFAVLSVLGFVGDEAPLRNQFSHRRIAAIVFGLLILFRVI
jgi:hypothetical protein